MRVSRKPWNEGSLAKIYDLFFRPLVARYCQDQDNPKKFIEDLFDVDYRIIRTFVANKSFKMPGLYYLTGQQKVQGLGYRQVGAEDLLWVREDRRQPEHLATVDVEFMGGVGSKDQVFSLSPSEWNSIRAFLRPLNQN